MKTTIKKATLPVLNLSCAGCATNSQKALRQQTGVIEAEVNFATRTASIEYDTATTSLEKLKTAVQDAGYDMLIEEDKDDEEDSLERIDRERYQTLKKNVIFAVILAVPLMLFAMYPPLMHLSYANYVMWILATPILFFAGKQFFVNAYKQAKHKTATMDTLVALSAGIAYIFSIFNTVYPSFWTDRGLEPHVYFEAAAIVITFILIGRLLEDRAKGSTSASIKKLIGLQPKTVTRINADGTESIVSIKEIQVGEILLVKPGDKIAVDGVITSGSSFVDESMITGEPISIEKTKDATVYAGTINQKGSFQFKAEKIGTETFLAQIIKMVQDAQGSKAPVQKLVDKIAGIFVPIVIALSILVFIAWFFLGGDNGFTYGLLTMITILVVACPCALGLATPTAIMVGIGKGAEHGILIKNAESLESAKDVNAIVLDKTGTITEGKPTVTDVLWVEPETDELKNILYSIERSSEHPLAEAITNHFNGRFLDNVKIENVSGKGIIGHYENQEYSVGNWALSGDNLAHQVWIQEKLDTANTVVGFSKNKQLIAIIAMSDAIKENSRKAVDQLKAMGIDVYMLTGDNKETAKAVASAVNIDHYIAGSLPQDKLEFVKKLQAEGKIVAMVGDGINDSAALAQANVSIAMGRGSDIAIDTAKMTIISGDISKISQAIKLSRQTVTTIKQNLFWAFIYNLIAIPIAAGILFPFNGFLLNPMFAGAAMALSSISVVGNSIRLKLKK